MDSQPKQRARRSVKRAGWVLALGLAAWGAPALQAQQPPIPSEPVYRDRGAPQGAQQRGYDRQTSDRQRHCVRLERELADDWMRGQQSQGQLPRIEEEIREYDRVYHQTQSRAEREGCYERGFIFGRSLVRTPRCIQMHEQIEDARRQLARLEQQRESAARGGGRNRQDDLIRELARYGCGEQYEQEARRRDGGGFSGWFGDQPMFDRREPRRDVETSRIVPFATYRTMCVRTCDGYYFPVSFSTLPNNFANDAGQCQSRCAAPTELFVYRNPGEEPEQMVSLDGSTPYRELPNAFRHQKEYVEGCSCNAADHDIQLLQDAAGSEATAGAGGFETITETAPPVR